MKNLCNDVQWDRTSLKPALHLDRGGVGVMLPLSPRLIFWPSGQCTNSLLHVQGMLWPGLVLGLPGTLDYKGYLILHLHYKSCFKSLWVMDFLGCSLHPLLVWQPKTCKSRDTAVTSCGQANNVFTIKLSSVHHEVQLTAQVQLIREYPEILINKTYQPCLMCSPVSAKVNILPWAAGL